MIRHERRCTRHQLPWVLGGLILCYAPQALLAQADPRPPCRAREVRVFQQPLDFLVPHRPIPRSRWDQFQSLPSRAAFLGILRSTDDRILSG